MTHDDVFSYSLDAKQFHLHYKRVRYSFYTQEELDVFRTGLFAAIQSGDACAYLLGIAISGVLNK
jgi:hypothetical protein